MNYIQQKNKELYARRSYNHIMRFISYFNQIDSILTLVKDIPNATVLEVGKGNGLVSDHWKKLGLNVKTFDFAEDLKPDYVGDMTQIGNIVKEKFDVVCAFEVLEHVKYEDVPAILIQLHNLSNKFVAISVPQSFFVISFWGYISRLGHFKKLIQIPWNKTHKFDGEHYWELGKKGYPVRAFRDMLKEKAVLLKEF